MTIAILTEATNVFGSSMAIEFERASEGLSCQVYS